MLLLTAILGISCTLISAISVRANESPNPAIAEEPPTSPNPPETDSPTDSPILPANPDSTPTPLPTLDSDNPDEVEPVTPVFELVDVEPTDWAYQALQALIQRYGTIVGYSDSTFRGNRALTRYEFAAALNATLQELALFMQMTQEELEAIERLQAEFADELAEIEGKVERLERILQPFSTTSKLNAEVVFALSGVAEAEKADGSQTSTDSNPTLSNQVRLNIDTSFTGRDRLRTRLQARNITGLDTATGTDMARLAFQGNNQNDIQLSRLEYLFPVGDAEVYVSATGASLNDSANTLNPFFSGSAEGSISRFGQRNPIYRQGGGAGLGVEYEFTDVVSLSLGYVAESAALPDVGVGNSAYGAIAQLTFKFSKTAGLGLTYVHSYNSLNTGTGSDRANDPFAEASQAVTGNSLGLQTAIGLTPNIAVSGWLGFTEARASDLPNDPTADIFNWAVTLAFPDLGKEGNLLGLAFGQPPKVTDNEFEQLGTAYQDPDTSFHLEAFYRLKVNDFITITPGVLVITNPEHDRDNDNLYIGVIRTTFSF
jgi:Carbohydrate-selective porin, OprB family/S-layer homology domain